MNDSIFNLVTAANVVAYWLEKNVNEQPMLGETLFPAKKEVGIKLDWIKGANNQPIGLRLAAYDTKAIRRDRKGIEEFNTKMPFFKESKYIDEEMRQQLNTLIGSNNTAVINSIIAKIFDDEIELLKASNVTLERMRMEALSEGTVTLGSNGQAFEYDYEIPAEQKLTASVNWSDPSADIIKEINDIKRDMKAKGVTIAKAICNSSVVDYIVRNESIVKQIYALAQGAIPSVTSERALSYLQEETGIVFYVYDNVYVNENEETVKYMKDDTVVFAPLGALGNTHFGTTPEESDLMTGRDAEVSIVNTGVAVTTYGTVDPVNKELKVSMVALPSFERANEVCILNVVNTTI